MMSPYMVGKLAPNRTPLKREFAMCAPKRGYFRAVHSRKGKNFASSPPPPSLNDSGGVRDRGNIGDHTLPTEKESA